MTTTPNLKSPRLQQLVSDLKSGTPNALQEFWDEVKAAGLPYQELIEITKTNEDDEEERAIDEDHVWVTFLYEGDEDTKHVALLGGLMFERQQKATDDDKAAKFSLLHRLENTNVFYWTTKIRKTFRTQYLMPVNHELLENAEIEKRFPTDEEKEAYYQTIYVHDPANPKCFEFANDPTVPDYREDRPTTRIAVLEAPDAAPLTYPIERDNVAKGSVSDYKWESDIFELEVHNWVYLPPDYDAERDEPYHLLIVFDGYTYVGGVPTATILDNLLADDKIPPTVALFVSNFKDLRNEMLPPNNKLPQAFVDEIMPYMRDHYQITNKPENVILAGASLGGLASAWNAFKHPELFGNVLSQSGSYWWSDGLMGKEDGDMQAGWLIREYLNSEKLPIKFYMDVGREENKNFRGKGFSHQGLNRHMRDVLIAKGYDITYTEYDGGHDYAWWQQTLADGLTILHGTQ